MKYVSYELVLVVTMDGHGFWICSSCTGIRYRLFHLYMAHLRSQHAMCKINLLCSLEDCPNNFESVSGYYKHVRTKHPRWLTRNPNKPGAREYHETLELERPNESEHAGESNNLMDTSSDMVMVDSEAMEDSEDVWNIIGIPEVEDQRKQACAFRLQFQEDCQLTYKNTNRMIKSMMAYMKQTRSSTACKILRHMKISGVPDHVVQSCLQVIKEHCAEDPFQNIRTRKSHDAEIKRYFTIVEPVKVVLVKEVKDNVTVGSSRRSQKRFTTKEKSFMYVPLLESLKQILSSPSLRSPIENRTDTRTYEDRPDVMWDVFDGDFIPGHSVLKNENALALIIYYDDVEFVNAICTKASTVHKLGMFYFSIVNLHPMYRSSLSSIFLLAAARTCDISKFGMDRILEPAIRDAELLQAGYEFTLTNGQRLMKYGSIALISGDTPAINLMGGFKEGVGGANRPCRSCMISSEQLANVQTFDSLVSSGVSLRTEAEHDQQIKGMDEASTLQARNSLSTAFGVNRRSVLMDLPHFDITKQLPQDIMHVLLEGVVNMHVRFFLRSIIVRRKLVTAQYINLRLKGFPYGPSHRRHEPTPLKLDNINGDKLKQKARQMWFFLQILGFLIQDKLDLRHDEEWCLVQKLLVIVNTIFSPIIARGGIPGLQRKIGDYISSFVEIYPGHFTPKLHYLLHIPTEIQRFGPPRRYWCMRFEGKHMFFKSLVNKKTSFVNLPYTLSHRHQRKVASDFMETGLGCDHPIVSQCVIPGEVLCVIHGEAIDTFKALLQKDNPRVAVDHVHEVNDVECNGITYTPSRMSYVAVDVDCDCLPVFGSISKIFIINSKIVAFELKIHETIRYVEEVNAYELSPFIDSYDRSVVLQNNLLTYEVHHTYVFNNKPCVFSQVDFMQFVL